MLRLSRASILRAITLAGALCVAAIASPAPASAGTYTINFCNTSASHSFYGWTESETQGTSGGIPFYWGPSNDCGNNGTYVRFEVNTVPQSTAFDSVSGSGWNDTPVDGIDPIDYQAVDRGAGVSKVHFFVDGSEQRTQMQSNSCDYEGRVVPCALTRSGRFTLDTTKLAEGAHTV